MQKIRDEEKSTTTRQSSLLRHYRDESLMVLHSTLNFIPCGILRLRSKWKFFSRKKDILKLNVPVVYDLLRCGPTHH